MYTFFQGSFLIWAVEGGPLRNRRTIIGDFTLLGEVIKKKEKKIE